MDRVALAFGLTAPIGALGLGVLIAVDTLRARRLVVARKTPAALAVAQPLEREVMDIVQETQALGARVVKLVADVDTVIEGRVAGRIAEIEAGFEKRVEDAVAAATANYEAMVTGLNGQISDLESKFAALAGPASGDTGQGDTGSGDTGSTGADTAAADATVAASGDAAPAGDASGAASAAE